MKQTVVVTGASTGIGKVIAQLFHQKGFNVVMNSANETHLRNAWQEMGSPDNCTIVPGDVSDQSVCNKIIEAAEIHFGGVDVLVNNAGVFAPKPFLEVTESDLDFYFGVNLKGTFFTSQAAIKSMLNRGKGNIINLGTVLVDHALGGFPATAPVVSKGGIHALTRQLAAEFGKQQIRVNTIAPGIIRSPLQGKIGITDSDSLAGLHLLNRIGEPEMIAEMAFQLATNSFITGEIIRVDGGHVAGHHLG